MAAGIDAVVLRSVDQRQTSIATLSDLGLLSLLFMIAAVLTAAIVMQYGYGEIPCALCLLQRVAMFGICFGLMHHFRRGDGTRGIGLALVSTVFLLFVAGRQTLIDIYPRPGHSYVGSAVLGLHMPVWSVLIALGVLTALSLQIAIAGAGHLQEGAAARRSARLVRWIGLYVTALCAINAASAFLQCGLEACATTGYLSLG